jgi:hypothetical protein
VVSNTSENTLPRREHVRVGQGDFGKAAKRSLPTHIEYRLQSEMLRLISVKRLPKKQAFLPRKSGCTDVAGHDDTTP